MIEVFLVNDYNKLADYAAVRRLSLPPDCTGMVMSEDGETIGLMAWRMADGCAEIVLVSAPDSYGQYHDLLFRSGLNYLKDNSAEVTVFPSNEYYLPLGFKESGGKMTAKSNEIKFPHMCGGGK